MYNKLTFITAGLLTISISANAEETNQTNNQTLTHEQAIMYGSVGSVGIDKQVAFNEGIGDSATSIRLGYEKQTNHFVWGLGISGLLYDDKNKFSQEVQSTWGGKESSKDSEASALGLYGELGYRHAFNEKLSATFMGGYDLTLTSDRGIGYCTDCYSEDIDVSAGLYIAPRLDIQFNRNILLQLSYQNYLSGDLSSGFMLTLGLSY